MRLLLLLAALVVWHSTASAQTARFRVGDDPRWAIPDWDDADWERRPLYVPPDTAAVLWLRLDLEVGHVPALGLEVAAVAARDVFWDGVRIGQAGRVGTDRASEVPGPIDATFPVPDSLAQPGPHVVAVRMSTFRRPPSIQYYIQGVSVGDLRDLAGWPFRATGLSLVFLGGFVLVGMYYGVLWAVDRDRLPYLLMSLLCLAVAALVVAESWRAIVGYTYDLHLARLWIVTGLTCTIAVLLVAVFMAQFRVPRGRTLLSVLAAAVGLGVVLVGGFDGKAYVAFAASLVAALAITGWAVWHGKVGAQWALAGVALCLGALVVFGYRFLDAAFFSAFGLLTAGALAGLGLQTRDERRRYLAARAEAARLEAELLKKHLQPHFLMNTLTSILEWVETDPATGARALEALADELRALSDISGEQLITVGQELALCRSHLEVMSFRREVTFVLDAEGVDLEAPIPPAVLHTLVENAITHNAYPPGTVRLTLEEARGGGRRELTLRAPLAGPPRERVLEGGGLRYVRGRLEESVAGQWSLSSSVEDGDWVTRIGLPALEGATSPLP